MNGSSNRPQGSAAIVWPADRLGEAIHALALAAGLSRLPLGPLGSEAAGSSPASGEALSEVESVAERLGLDADPVEMPWSELRRALPRIGPALLRLPGEEGGYLALLRGRRRVHAVAPDGRRHRLHPARLAGWLSEPIEQRQAAANAPLIEQLPLTAARRRRACLALVAGRLAEARGLDLFLLAPAGGMGGHPLARRWHGSSWRRIGVALIAALAAAEALSLLGWLLLGRGLLAGRMQPALLYGWALLLLALPAVRVGELAAGAALAQRVGLLLRRRLFAAVLALGPEALRGEGIGRLLGRVLAAEELERLPLTAAPGILVAAAQLAGAVVALTHGAAPLAHLLSLAIALALAGGLVRSYQREHRACAERRLTVTGQLIEAMVGHRTRLAQGVAVGSGDAEDANLAVAHSVGSRADAWGTALCTGLPRLWLVAGLAALAPALGDASVSGGQLAASLGGLLLGQGGLALLARSLREIAAAATAAGELRPLLAARSRDTACRVMADRARPAGRAGLAAPWLAAAAAAANVPRILEGRDLECRLPDRPRPILSGANIELRRGDRILLEGASGAGKSTLASILAGERPPDSGLLLLGGLDLPTIGSLAWRRQVVAVPQLHANHLFADSLAFNLLLGRRWPPSPGDLADADLLCRELGLGPLLDRLPAGLEQRIGEAGWQLSDGEASRVCLARALLQAPDVLILDESLGALDPETRLLALAVVCRRAGSLVVIAHAED